MGGLRSRGSRRFGVRLGPLRRCRARATLRSNTLTHCDASVFFNGAISFVPAHRVSVTHCSGPAPPARSYGGPTSSAARYNPRPPAREPYQVGSRARLRARCQPRGELQHAGPTIRLDEGVNLGRATTDDRPFVHERREGRHRVLALDRSVLRIIRDVVELSAERRDLAQHLVGGPALRSRIGARGPIAVPFLEILLRFVTRSLATVGSANQSSLPLFAAAQ